MNRKQKPKKRGNGGNNHWRWEDEFEDGNRPKMKFDGRKNNRQQVRHAIRVGHYEEVEDSDDE